MPFWNRKASGESVLVRTTVGRRADAERIARTLVDQGLAACVHIAEIGSVYRWEGRVRQETEFLVEARTTRGAGARVEQAMLAGHPYKEPVVEQVAGTVNPSYARWMAREVR